MYINQDVPLWLRIIYNIIMGSVLSIFVVAIVKFVNLEQYFQMTVSILFAALVVAIAVIINIRGGRL